MLAGEQELGGAQHGHHASPHGRPRHEFLCEVLVWCAHEEEIPMDVDILPLLLTVILQS